MLYVDGNYNNSVKTLPNKDKAAKTAKVAKVTSQQRQPKQSKVTKDSKNSKEKTNKKEPIFCDLLDFDKEYTEKDIVQSQKI